MPATAAGIWFPGEGDGDGAEKEASDGEAVVDPMGEGGAPVQPVSASAIATSTETSSRGCIGSTSIRLTAFANQTIEGGKTFIARPTR